MTAGEAHRLADTNHSWHSGPMVTGNNIRKSTVEYECVSCGHVWQGGSFNQLPCPNCQQHAPLRVRYPNGDCIECEHCYTDSMLSPSGYCIKHEISTEAGYICDDFERPERH